MVVTVAAVIVLSGGPAERGGFGGGREKATPEPSMVAHLQPQYFRGRDRRTATN